MVATKVKKSTKQHLNLLNDFFENFQNWCKPQKNPSIAELAKCLSSDFEISINGKVLCHNLQEYLERINSIKRKFTNFEITGPVEEPLFAEDNKIIVKFEVSLHTPEAGRHTFYKMAIGTIEDDKFVRWEEVSHRESKKEWFA